MKQNWLRNDERLKRKRGERMKLVEMKECFLCFGFIARLQPFGELWHLDFISGCLALGRNAEEEKRRLEEEIARNLKEEALQKAAEEERLKDQRKVEEEHRRALQEQQIEDERKQREEEQRIAEQRRQGKISRTDLLNLLLTVLRLFKNTWELGEKH